MPIENEALIILGNQLFPLPHFSRFKNLAVFMAEDVGLCTHYRYHKHKLLHFLISMREFASALEKGGHKLTYSSLREKKNRSESYLQRLERFLIEFKIKTVNFYEIEDKFFEKDLLGLFTTLSIRTKIYQTPMFLFSREDFRDHLEKRKNRPFMKVYYEERRQREKILTESGGGGGGGGGPVGGKWSFDRDNRKKFPSKENPPEIKLERRKDQTFKEVSELVQELFSDHPGDCENFWIPSNFLSANKWLDEFIDNRLYLFGDYEDAISVRSDFLFHSALSPLLNIGLLTPQIVLDRLLKELGKVALNSLEGIVRQIMGWREFIRGTYQHFSEQQESQNFFEHQKNLNDCWYSGDTGIPPLDFAIKKAQKLGYCHHIERLMVIGNMMLLCELAPKEVHRWFMEMFVDSSDWVMGPNVFGMAIFSDGGIFATKPYICASNYYRKMGDFGRGPWEETVDGLYWRFVKKHRKFLEKNHRMSLITKKLDSMELERQRHIFKKAEEFIARVTH